MYSHKYGHNTCFHFWWYVRNPVSGYLLPERIHRYCHGSYPSSVRFPPGSQRILSGIYLSHQVLRSKSYFHLWKRTLPASWSAWKQVCNSGHLHSNPSYYSWWSMLPIPSDSLLCRRFLPAGWSVPGLRNRHDMVSDCSHTENLFPHRWLPDGYQWWFPAVICGPYLSVLLLPISRPAYHHMKSQTT